MGSWEGPCDAKRAFKAHRAPGPGTGTPRDPRGYRARVPGAPAGPRGGLGSFEALWAPCPEPPGHRGAPQDAGLRSAKAAALEAISNCNEMKILVSAGTLTPKLVWVQPYPSVVFQLHLTMLYKLSQFVDVFVVFQQFQLHAL